MKYGYDLAGRVTDVNEPKLGYNNRIAGFDYDDNGNRSKLTYYLEAYEGGDEVTLDYTYNLDNMLTGFTTSGGPTFTLSNVDVDGMGRLWSADETITKADQSQRQHSYVYSYDMRSQLLYGSTSNVGSSNWVSDSYSYDDAGNVQSHVYETSAPSSSTTSYGFVGDLMASATSGDGGDNFTLGWDDNGNLTLKDEAVDTSLIYNWNSKLRYADYDGQSIALKYDPFGNRVLKDSSVSDKRKYIVDISGNLPTILLEIDPSDDTVKKTYVYANAQILAQHLGKYNAPRYFYLHDRLGSIRMVIDTTADVNNHYTYDPFGKMIATESTETTESPFKFTGQYYDSEIAQYYLRARMYDPQLFRFTARGGL